MVTLIGPIRSLGKKLTNELGEEFVVQRIFPHTSSSQTAPQQSMHSSDGSSTLVDGRSESVENQFNQNNGEIIDGPMSQSTPRTVTQPVTVKNVQCSGESESAVSSVSHISSSQIEAQTFHNDADTFSGNGMSGRNGRVPFEEQLRRNNVHFMEPNENSTRILDRIGNVQYCEVVCRECSDKHYCRVTRKGNVTQKVNEGTN